MTNAVQSSAAIPATNAVEASTAAMNAVGIVPAGITDAADAISTTVSNPVAAAKEVVSNFLEKGSTNVTNEPVSSVGTSPVIKSHRRCWFLSHAHCCFPSSSGTERIFPPHFGHTSVSGFVLT